MSLRSLFRVKVRKPARSLGWNLMFLLCGAILLAALTQADLLELGVDGGCDSPEVEAGALPDPEPLKDSRRGPLQRRPVDAANGPLGSFDAPKNRLQRPDYPLVGVAYHNPGYDPELGIAHFRQSSPGWLTHHQNAEGYWSAAHFADNSCREGAARTGADDAGAWNADLACTSLALLSFIGAGYDHKDGPYKRNVRQAIIWLRDNQDDQGFKPARGLRDHALAVMALSETYGLSGDNVIKPIAEKAVQQLLNMREADSGWGEYSGYPADTISTA